MEPAARLRSQARGFRIAEGGSDALIAEDIAIDELGQESGEHESRPAEPGGGPCGGWGGSGPRSTWTNAESAAHTSSKSHPIASTSTETEIPVVVLLNVVPRRLDSRFGHVSQDSPIEPTGCNDVLHESGLAEHKAARDPARIEAQALSHRIDCDRVVMKPNRSCN